MSGLSWFMAFSMYCKLVFTGGTCNINMGLNLHSCFRDSYVQIVVGAINCEKL